MFQHSNFRKITSVALLSALLGGTSYATYEHLNKPDTLSTWVSNATPFVKARLEAALIPEFSADDQEFVRRTAFSMIAVAAVHLKAEPDETILAWLPLVEAHAGDDRNFVKKAVNWALRQTGKRNARCHGPALSLAQALAELQDRTARWIGKDAVRELTSSAVLTRLGLQPLPR